MNPHDLLDNLASDLWFAAERAVPLVLKNGPAAHPLGPYIAAQNIRDKKCYQLPEPLLGPIPAPCKVLVVGQNPGYDPDNESHPRFGTSLDDYVAWFRTFCIDQRHPSKKYLGKMVAGKWTKIRHYAEVEEILAASAILGPRALGSTAAYVDAHPWKWAKARKGSSPPGYGPPKLGTEVVRVQICERVSALANALQPTLVLTLGRHAARPFGTLPALSKPPNVVERAKLDGWTGMHLASLHLNARGVPKSYYDEVKKRLVEKIP